MRLKLLFLGMVFLFFGILLTVSLIGALIGVPLTIIGAFMAFVAVFIPTTQDDSAIKTEASTGGSQPSQNICPSCGASNPGDAKYCSVCGNKIERASLG